MVHRLNPFMAEVFRYQQRVTYAECTVGNHVYYARYLNLLEAARGELFRHAVHTFHQLQEQDVIFPVVEVHLKYKGPARYDDLLTIEISVTELGRIRLNFAYRILNDKNAVLLEGETWHVCTGLNEKPKRAPESLVAALQGYVRE